MQKLYNRFNLIICKDTSPIKVQGYDTNTTQDIDNIVVLSIVINGYYFPDMIFIIVLHLGYDILLRKEWFAQYDILPDYR
jgi:hypothetical protein